MLVVVIFVLSSFFSLFPPSSLPNIIGTDDKKIKATDPCPRLSKYHMQVCNEDDENYRLLHRRSGYKKNLLMVVEYGLKIMQMVNGLHLHLAYH